MRLLIRVSAAGQERPAAPSSGISNLEAWLKVKMVAFPARQKQDRPNDIGGNRETPDRLLTPDRSVSRSFPVSE